MNTFKTLTAVLLFSILFLSCNMAEGGVKFSNNMDKYALEYIQKNNLLNEDEKIEAYYDYTVSMDGTEAAILTNTRVIYHNAEAETSSIFIKDIIEVKHREVSLIGDIIEMYTADGGSFVVEIAPLNNGELFLNLLKMKVGAVEK